jgi:hypothetical protein
MTDVDQERGLDPQCLAESLTMADDMIGYAVSRDPETLAEIEEKKRHVGLVMSSTGTANPFGRLLDQGLLRFPPARPLWVSGTQS